MRFCLGLLSLYFVDPGCCDAHLDLFDDLSHVVVVDSGGQQKVAFAVIIHRMKSSC